MRPSRNGTHSFFFFVHPMCYLRPSFLFPSYSTVTVTQIRGHIAGSSPPSPLRFEPCILSREDFSSSLVDSRRIVLTHAMYSSRRSQQLILFIVILQINSKSHHGGIRTHGPLLILVEAFEGYHYNRKGGVTVAGRPRLTKAGRRWQTG